MFRETAELYDVIYSFKDYAAETAALIGHLERHRRSPGRRLLDVACGTGHHLAHLQAHYDVEGLDLDPAMLVIARLRLPGVPLHQGDMQAFDLGRRFDAVTCLFSSIGYVRTLEGLEQTARTLARHLLPGGVLALEPWLTPETFRPGTLHALFIDQPELKIARFNRSTVEGRLSVLDFHYLIATSQGIEHRTERHELGLFTLEEYAGALAGAGLRPVVDPEGLSGRSLLLGLAPPSS